MATTPREHTLFLWPTANFPRRLSYWLILKGFVTDLTALTNGKIISDTLRLNIVNVDFEADAWQTSDPADPFPDDGKRLPALRVRDTSSGQTSWIHESTSILTYLEELYPHPTLQGIDPLQRARNNDLVSLINEAIQHTNTYIRHASKSAPSYTNFHQRSAPTALDCITLRNSALERLQSWAQENGALTAEQPWLAVLGSSEAGPGIPDLCLAAWERYMWLSYDLDMLEAEPFAPLREWRTRFVALPWVKDAEDQERGPAVHPEQFKMGKDIEFR